MKDLLFRAVESVRRFWMQSAAPLPLAVLRIGLGILLVIQAAVITPRLLDLYGPAGVTRWEAARELIPAAAPNLSWASGLFVTAGLSIPEGMRLLLAVHALAAIGLLVGWRTRICAVTAWLTLLIIIKSNDATVYGAVEFLNIAMFYSCLFPVGATLSVDRLLGRETGLPSADARVGVRILQLHLVVVYVTSGFEKATGSQWWNGEAIWRSLMRSDLATADFSWLSSVPWLAVMLAWGTLLLETGYGFWVWPQFSRRWWAWATVSLHLGISLTMGLYLFAAIMILLNVCAWIIPCEIKASRALHRVANRPVRFEPCYRKRRMKRYAELKMPRHEAKLAILKGVAKN